MNFPDLSLSVRIRILSYLPLRDLVQFGNVSNYYHRLIRQTEWHHTISITNGNIIRLMKVIPQYQFTNFFFPRYPFSWYLFPRLKLSSEDLSNILKLLSDSNKKQNSLKIDISLYKITDKMFESLTHCTDLNLSGCNQITDKIVKLLGNISCLNLCYCNQITDESIPYLAHCQRLNLSGCQITDANLLRHVPHLNLSNTKITDHGIKDLKCHTLHLRNCPFITNEGFRLLSTCYEIDLSRNKQVTDETVSYLTLCQIVNLSYCLNITDRALEHLISCHTLLIQSSNVTDAGLKFIRKPLYYLNIYDCRNITDFGLMHLECQIIELSSFYISDKMITSLQQKMIVRVCNMEEVD